MYQIRNKTAHFQKVLRKSVMDTQQIFHNLTLKYLKSHLTKENSESHLGGYLSGISLQSSEKEIESVPLFKSTLKLKLLSFSSEVTCF